MDLEQEISSSAFTFSGTLDHRKQVVSEACLNTLPTPDSGSNVSKVPVNPTKSLLDDLPTEILLNCYAFMELKTLIASQGVCKEWRRLIPLANLHTPRRRLLGLFTTIIDTPNFEKTRSWTLQNLHQFDRQAYIDTLLSQYPCIPEDFRIWILEWPARLVINCIWPGLPCEQFHAISISRRNGVNYLGYTPPQLSAIVYNNETPDVKFIPGLLVWKGDHVTWLLFDANPDLFGRVVDLYPGEAFGCIPDTSDPGALDGVVHESWIDYQTRLWSKFAKRAQDVKYIDNPANYVTLERDKVKPIEISFNGTSPSEIPAPRWTQRDDEAFQGYLEHYDRYA